MDGFSFFNPVRIEFGKGVSRKLRDAAGKLGAKKTLLVASSRAQELACAEELKKDKQFELFFFSEIESNPPIETVDKAAAIARENDCNLVVGMGGGSALDVAKLAAALKNNEGSCRQYCEGKKISQKGVPWIAVPTTAGSGSEVTPAAVVTNKEKKTKDVVRADSMFADAALVDPELTYSMPAKLTAATGLDALAHAIEPMFFYGSPITAAFGCGALERVWNFLPRAVENGRQDEEAREKMAEASLLGGLSVLKGAAEGHRMANIMTLEKGTEHGFACAITLPLWLEYHWDSLENRAKIGRIIDAENKADAAVKMREFLKKVGAPVKLSELGYSKKDAERIADKTFEGVKAKNGKISKEELKQLLDELI